MGVFVCKQKRRKERKENYPVTLAGSRSLSVCSRIMEDEPQSNPESVERAASQDAQPLAIPLIVGCASQVLHTSDKRHAVPYISRCIPWAFSIPWRSTKNPSDWLVEVKASALNSHQQTFVQSIMIPLVDVLAFYNRRLLQLDNTDDYSISKKASIFDAPDTLEGLSSNNTREGTMMKNAFLLSLVADRLISSYEWQSKQGSPDIVDLTASSDHLVPISTGLEEASSPSSKGGKGNKPTTSKAINWIQDDRSNWIQNVQKSITDMKTFMTNRTQSVISDTCFVTKGPYRDLSILLAASNQSNSMSTALRSISALYLAAAALRAFSLFKISRDFDDAEISFNHLAECVPYSSSLSRCRVIRADKETDKLGFTQTKVVGKNRTTTCSERSTPHPLRDPHRFYKGRDLHQVRTPV